MSNGDNFKIRKYHFGDTLIIEIPDGEVYVGKYIQDDPDFKICIQVLIEYTNVKELDFGYEAKKPGLVVTFHEDHVKRKISREGRW